MRRSKICAANPFRIRRSKFIRLEVLYLQQIREQGEGGHLSAHIDARLHFHSFGGRSFSSDISRPPVSSASAAEELLFLPRLASLHCGPLRLCVSLETTHKDRRLRDEE